MKKFLALILIAFTTVSIAQESVKLRLNYKKGDSYIMKMVMNQDMSVMAMNMKMDAKIDIVDIKEDTFISEMKFTKIDMGMLQGGMQMSASTDDKDEDLDATSKQMKSGLDQMLTVTMTSVTSNLGKVIGVKAEPNLPGMEQLKDQANNSVAYPEKALKVGDTWMEEKTEQGVVTKVIYKVKSITSDVVNIEVSGELSGLATGTMKGDMIIDRESGVSTSSNIKTSAKVQGMEMKSSVSMTMEKVK